MRLRTLTILAAFTALVFVACGDDDLADQNGENATTNASTGNNGQTSNNAATNNATTNNATTNSSSPNNDTTNNSTPNNGDACTTPEPTVDPVDSCADGGYTECAWSGDCADDQRCQDVGNVQNSGVTCCITACRGEKDLGEECSSIEECESGSCIARNDDPAVCSRPCDTAADCGGDLECVDIPFLAYPKWCVTPRSN